MGITIDYVKQKFGEFNQKMFSGKLPMPIIELGNAKTSLGSCTCKTRRRWPGGPVEKYDFRLRFSTRYDLSEQEQDDVIIHEMIHYYIDYNDLPDTSTHGLIFRQMMQSFNTRFGRHITVSHRHGPLKTRPQAERRTWHVIAHVFFRDGREGFKVLPRVVTSIRRYCDAMAQWDQVSHTRLYWSDNPFFYRFPNSAALKVHIIEAKKLNEELSDAEPLEICS